ncbi:hypothetical protein FQ377_07155 [Arthrobacter echini]|uniref:DNA-3-methyladenine glycosylase 2 family protein n=1 Tax=Arthrobacter echini TaxID=1529066 RepID=A0A5D0XQW7_9MICC|nr:hypothetical protein [Arthrobacter echini]TYC98789.1 hypothetical protein FQ377_07155 [Arthrobacter echini]
MTDVDLLQAMIEKELPREKWVVWPGGRAGAIEAALIDAVLSIQAKYGSEHNGVRGSVNRYVAAVSPGSPANDLRRLVALDAAELQGLLNDQMISGRTKASAIQEAARNLVGVGVEQADDLEGINPEHKKAYTKVHGLGSVTWEYFCMLLGTPGVKADTWIVAAVSRAVKRKASPQEAREIVIAVAEALNESPTHLDHALWAYERSRTVEVESANV